MTHEERMAAWDAEMNQVANAVEADRKERLDNQVAKLERAIRNTDNHNTFKRLERELSELRKRGVPARSPHVLGLFKR